jgi:transcriptional regulator with XRE-family HTH domain
MNKFSDWITHKFVEWQASQGRRKTIQEFAAYLGVSRPLLNMWINGNKKPGSENIKLLSEIFGNEIYDVLNLPRPNPYLQKINRVWEYIPEDVQKQLAEKAEAYEAQNELQRIKKTRQRRKTGKTE